MNLSALYDVAPLFTAGGVAVAAFSLVWNGRRERRRKTLEACEKFVFDSHLRDALDRVVLAVNHDAFTPDTLARTEVDTLRASVSALLNALETICLGVNTRLYSRDIATRYLKVYVTFFAEHFLVATSPRLVSRLYLSADLPETRRLFPRELVARTG